MAAAKRNLFEKSQRRLYNSAERFPKQKVSEEREDAKNKQAGLAAKKE